MGNSRLKMLHIVGDSQYGGGAVLIIRLAREAANAGYEVSVLSTNSQLQSAIRDAGLHVVNLDCIWREVRPMRDFAGLIRLFIFLIQNKYDIVHTHTSKAGFVGRISAFMARIPVVVHTVHGFAFHEQSSWKLVKVYSFLERIAAHMSDRVVTVSHYHRDWALRLGICKSDKVVAIPNGISVDRVVPLKDRTAFRESLGIENDEIVLISAGRLAPQKGIEHLIDALKVLVDQGIKEIRLLLAGDGPIRAELVSQVRNVGLDSHVVFLGFRSDIGDILACGDIAVMPTEREGLSIALLEAMAVGLPIITTAIGSNKEVTISGRYAKLVDPKDMRGLVVAISEYISNITAAKEIGIAAKQHFLSTYTEDVMLSSYLSLYSELISEKSK